MALLRCPTCDGVLDSFQHEQGEVLRCTSCGRCFTRELLESIERQAESTGHASSVSQKGVWQQKALAGDEGEPSDMKVILCPICAGRIATSAAPDPILVRCPSCGHEFERTAIEAPHSENDAAGFENQEEASGLSVPNIARRVLWVVRPDKDPRTWGLNWTFVFGWVGAMILVSEVAIDSFVEGDWGRGLGYSVMGCLVGVLAGVLLMVLAGCLFALFLPSAEVTAGEILQKRRGKSSTGAAIPATNSDSDESSQAITGMDSPAPVSTALQKPPDDTQH